MSMFGVDHGGVCIRACISFTVSFRMSMSMFGVDVRGGVCEVLVFCLHQEMLRRHQGLVLDHCKNDEEENAPGLHGSSDRLLLPH